MFRRAVPLVLFGSICLGCGSDPLRASDDGGDDPGNVPGRTPAEVAEAIGRGDESSSSVSLIVVYQPIAGLERLPTALAWNPAAEDELWVTMTEPTVDAPCTPTVGTGCDALEGKMAIIRGASGPSPETEIVVDGNSWHFLRRPMGLAFGPEERRQFLCTCGEARTANYTDEEVPYNGPVLWDADPELFGAAPRPPTNSTHVDMLHATPYCMGVAHEQANVYWVFNGDVGALDRYDFNQPHEPGADDHSDGEVWRYAERELLRVPGVPSHLAYDSRRRLLYASDSGNGRVVALDTASGFEDGTIVTYETIPTHLRMSGATVTEILAPGTLSVPSGLTLREGVLFVTDHETSRIIAMDLDGNVIRELETDLAPNSLAGISIGPDQKAYITDLQTGRVLRIEPI
jgi:hypothetical protein